MEARFLWEHRPLALASLQQRKYLRGRAIRIPRTGQLATRSHVFACPSQYRAHDRLARIKFSGSRRIIENAQNDNLILTIAKGKKQKRCALLQVWIGVQLRA
jgi:hypothetical protein